MEPEKEKMEERWDQDVRKSDNKENRERAGQKVNGRSKGEGRRG